MGILRNTHDTAEKRLLLNRRLLPMRLFYKNDENGQIPRINHQPPTNGYVLALIRLSDLRHHISCT